MKLSEALDGIGRSISYYPGLRKLCGSVSATVLFCQLFYWKGKESSEGGWIYKDSSELEEETGLSYKEQVSARKNLVENGLIEEKYDRLAHKMYFRIMVSSLNDKWEVPETTDGKFGKRPMVSSSIHKITTESTSEITEGSEKISLHADTDTDPIPSQTPFPDGKKPRSPREWANLRRAEIGKGPIRPKQSEKQLNSVGALLLADYFKSMAHSIYGLTFLAHDEDRKSVESDNGKLRKLMSAFYKRCDYDVSKARAVIDWFLEGEGEWCGYAPENCFKSEIVARFENKDITKKSASTGKIYE